MIEPREAVVDLGMVSGSSGAQIQKSVIVENRGTADLEMRYVESTCGCVRVEGYDATIPAGSAGTISLVVELGAERKSGVQSLKFATNDPGAPYWDVVVVWQAASPEVMVTPERVRIHTNQTEIGQGAKSGRAQILVLDKWDQRLEVLDLQHTPNLLVSYHDIVYRCPQGNKTHIIRLDAAVAPGIKAGPLSESVTLVTNHPKYGKLTVPITGAVSGFVTVSPQALVYRNVESSSVVPSRLVRLRSTRDEGHFHIKEIKTAHPWISVHPEAASKGQIDVRVDLDLSLLGLPNTDYGLKSQIVFILEAPEPLEAKVDVSVFFAPRSLRSRPSNSP